MDFRLYTCIITMGVVYSTQLAQLMSNAKYPIDFGVSRHFSYDAMTTFTQMTKKAVCACLSHLSAQPVQMRRQRPGPH